jgi:hypothetical protein
MMSCKSIFIYAKWQLIECNYLGSQEAFLSLKGEVDFFHFMISHSRQCLG